MFEPPHTLEFRVRDGARWLAISGGPGVTVYEMLFDAIANPRPRVIADADWPEFFVPHTGIPDGADDADWPLPKESYDPGELLARMPDRMGRLAALMAVEMVLPAWESLDNQPRHAVPRLALHAAMRRLFAPIDIDEWEALWREVVDCRDFLPDDAPAAGADLAGGGGENLFLLRAEQQRHEDAFCAIEAVVWGMQIAERAGDREDIGRRLNTAVRLATRSATHGNFELAPHFLRRWWHSVQCRLPVANIAEVEVEWFSLPEPRSPIDLSDKS